MEYSENFCKFKINKEDCSIKPAATSEAIEFKHPREKRLEAEALQLSRLELALKTELTINIEGRNQSKSTKFVKELHKAIKNFEQ